MARQAQDHDSEVQHSKVIQGALQLAQTSEGARFLRMIGWGLQPRQARRQIGDDGDPYARQGGRIFSV
jgi:hypothetical protein